MEKALKFEARNYSRLNNALELRLHQDAHEAIATCGIALASINVDHNDLNAHDAGTTLLADITKEAEKSADTRRLNDIDARRDKTITHIFALVRAYTDSPIAEEAEAAERLLVHVDKYKGLQKESLVEETTHIDSFVYDLRKLQNDLTTLHLDTAVVKLEDTNSDFKQLYTARRQEQTATALPPAKQVRSQIDKLLDDMLNSIAASYLLSRNDSDKERMLALATELNSIFKDVKRVANQKAGQKSTAKKAETEKAEGE